MMYNKKEVPTQSIGTRIKKQTFSKIRTDTRSITDN